MHANAIALLRTVDARRDMQRRVAVVMKEQQDSSGSLDPGAACKNCRPDAEAPKLEHDTAFQGLDLNQLDADLLALHRRLPFRDPRIEEHNVCPDH